MGNGMPLTRLLSKRELGTLIGLMNASLSCVHEGDLRKMMTDLKNIVPHDFAICGLAGIGKDGDIKSYKTVNVNYPNEWIELYMAKKYNLCDPVFLNNFAKLGLQRWSDTYKITPPPRKFLSDAHDFGLTGGYTFGMKNRTENTNSLFSLSGKSVENHERTSTILENVMPHFHEALIRIANGQENGEMPLVANISAREKEVLTWIKEGKSSWDVSKILNISERTVNYHVGNVMQKLGAVSRLHAVAIAAGSKLIDLD